MFKPLSEEQKAKNTNSHIPNVDFNGPKTPMRKTNTVKKAFCKTTSQNFSKNVGFQNFELIKL